MCNNIRNYIALLMYVNIFSCTAYAYDLPKVNLGTTSFVDGGPPGGKAGFYGFQYLQYINANSLKDNSGHSLPASKPNLNVIVALTQFIWISNKPLLHGKLGATFLLPHVWPSIDLKAPAAGNSGLGDIIFSPFIQWGPIIRKGRPIFMHRLNLAFRFPTGKYSSRTEINPGSNSYAFNPYWAGTWFVTSRFEISTRFHYLWVSKLKFHAFDLNIL